MFDDKNPLGKEVFDVSLEQLQKLEELCKQNLHLKDEMRESMAASYEESREQAFARMDCKAMYQSFAIEQIDGDTVKLDSGGSISCPVLADVLKDARIVVVFAVAAHGYEKLMEEAGDDIIASMMYGGWGVAFSTSTQLFIEDTVREHAHEQGLFTGRSWCPGENGVDMKVQKQLFELMDPSLIGIELKPTGLMTPFMSVSGVIGVGDEASLEGQETVLMV